MLHAESWLGKLSYLNVARTAARGAAPHKPLMLLTVIDLIESGGIPDGWVKYDVRLVSRFRDYWELVLERQRNQPDIPMPFHALGGARDQVWKTFGASGEPSEAKATTRLCALDPGLFACLQDAEFRRQARTTLVTIYFTPKEQVMLCARLGLPVPDTAAIEFMKLDADEFKARQKKGRDSRFKSDVLGGYYFTCALTGYRLDTEQSDQNGRILDRHARPQGEECDAPHSESNHLHRPGRPHSPARRLRQRRSPQRPCPHARRPLDVRQRAVDRASQGRSLHRSHRQEPLYRVITPQPDSSRFQRPAAPLPRPRQTPAGSDAL
jgi:predicted restriction endonuclease